MKLRGIPRLASWASGVALYFFALAMNAAMVLVLPLLFDLMRRSPRLAWLGILLVWMAPMAFAAAGHRVAHGLLNRLDPGGAGAASARVATSLWAGFVAWAALLLVSTTTGLITIVLDPPPADPDAFFGTLFSWVTQGFPGAARIAIWIALAAYVYELKRLAERPSAVSAV